MKKTTYIVFFIGAIFSFWHCGGDIGTPSCPNCPCITSIEPSEAAPGDTITIFGKNFDRFNKSGSVTIGGIEAIPTGDSSSTQIVVELADDTPEGSLDLVICTLNKQPLKNNILCSNEEEFCTPISIDVLPKEIIANTFETQYSNSGSNLTGLDIVELADEKILVVGNQVSFDERKGVIVKIEKAGDIEWAKEYGYPGFNNSLNSIIPLPNQDYVALGNTGDDILFVKTQNDGSQRLMKKLSLNGSSNCQSAILWNDKIVLTGGTENELYVCQIDLNGNKIPNSLETFSIGIGNEIIGTSDGGFAVIGTKSSSSGLSQMYLLKFNSSGSYDWSSTFGNSNGLFGNSIVQTSDNGFYLVGDGTPLIRGFVAKADRNGGEIWIKPYGNNTELARGICLAHDEGIIYAGSTYANGQLGAHLRKIDYDGESSWVSLFQPHYAVSLKKSRDNGYIFTGTLYSPSSNENGIYIVKTDLNGNVN